MRIIDLNDPNALNPYHRVAVALGNFDGLHLGHQSIIGRTRSGDADEISAVLLFKHHTQSELSAERFCPLTDNADKLAILERLGIDAVFMIDFDRDFMNLTKEAFIEKILVAKIHTSRIVVGQDYTFGRNAEGTSAFLIQAAATYGYAVDCVEDVTYHGDRISSTRIRSAIEAGDIEAANAMLGRTYEIGGSIVTGDRRGRLLGFPTANCELSFPYCLPRAGVYMTYSRFNGEGETYYGMTNIGTNPTFTEAKNVRIETHLFDFEGDVYDQAVRIGFIQYERPDMKFRSADALVKQMKADERQIRSKLPK